MGIHQAVDFLPVHPNYRHKYGAEEYENTLQELSKHKAAELDTINPVIVKPIFDVATSFQGSMFN